MIPDQHNLFFKIEYFFETYNFGLALKRTKLDQNFIVWDSKQASQTKTFLFRRTLTGSHLPIYEELGKTIEGIVDVEVELYLL